MAGGLLTYAVGSALLLALLWAGYRLLLRSQKIFRVNGALLILILCFSVCAPLLISRITVTAPEQGTVLLGLMTVGDAAEDAGPEGISAAGDMMDRTAGGLSLTEILAWVYVAGALMTLIFQVLVPVVSAVRLMAGGRRYRAVAGKQVVTVVEVPVLRGRKVEPMSWFGTVILPSDEDYPADSYVIRHELAHVQLRHSYMLLAASFLQCLQWFNPAAWLLLRDLRQNCEFEADDVVLSSGADRRDYQLALVEKAADGMTVSLANPFHKSSLYRRIAMIQKQTPVRSGVYLRLTYVLPVLVLAVMLFVRPSAAVPSYADAVYTAEHVEDSSLTEDMGPLPFSVVEVPPKFIGGDTDNFIEWLYSQLEYPEAARRAGAEARITIQFRIDREGALKDLRLMRLDIQGNRVEDFDYGVFYAEVEKTISSSLVMWTPGSIDDKPVSVTYAFPVSFQMKSSLRIDS